MDRVGFGRALGYGARHAAKALMKAADAATAPATSAPAEVSKAQTVSQPTKVAQVQAYGARSPAPARSDSGRATRSLFHPVKRYSGTVLLQVVGTFFAVFALLMAQAAWKFRVGLRQRWTSADAQHLWLTVGLFVVFGWFAVSSFLRARSLERS